MQHLSNNISIDGTKYDIMIKRDLSEQTGRQTTDFRQINIDLLFSVLPLKFKSKVTNFFMPDFFYF